MTEALGIAASVAGLMTIADSIVRKGFKFIKDVKDAEPSVQKLVEEVNNLSGVLHSLNNVVKRLEEDKQNIDPSTQIHYIESCYKTLTKIQGHLDEAVPATPLSKGAKLQWPSKKSLTKELLVEIERHKATMTLAMSAREMTALLEILARQEVIRDGLQDIKVSLDADRAERRKVVISEERRKMLQQLGATDARKWQDSNIRLRQPGTGVWFTDGAEFKSWLSTNQSKLWINGIPGAGKTILMWVIISPHLASILRDCGNLTLDSSSTIQEIERRFDSSHALAFFYCDYKDPHTHDPLNILGALARQLILQDEHCFAQLREFTQDHTMNDGIVRSHTPDELCELIRKVSKHFETTMIVVDGLDEITNNRADVTRLLRSLNTESGQIKTLFASRPEIDIGYELEDFVQISIAAMSSDLRLYVASEIDRRIRDRKLRIRDPSLKDHIMKSLVDEADGMFRWVACQMDYLCECSNDRDRREALKRLPPDLPSSYERILERVNRSSKENQDLVKKTLHWIVYANYEDDIFNTDELLLALAVRDGEECFDRSSMPTVEDVLHWCSSLVRRNITSSRLELAHFTVKEFLEAIDPVQKSSFQQYRLCGGHTILAKGCLNFILYQEFDGLPRPVFKCDDEDWWNEWCGFKDEYGFFEYACANWSYHVHDASWDDVKNDVLEVFNTEPTFQSWISGWLSYQHSVEVGYGLSEYFGKPLSPTRLHWAASFALDKLCAIFIEDGMNVSQPSCMGTPLYCAMLSRFAIYDYSEVKEMYAALDIEDRFWEQPAREKVVRQLVEAGADMDVAVDPENQVRALNIALDLEKWNDFYSEERNKHNVFIASVLLNAGALLSAEHFGLFHEALEMCAENITISDDVSSRTTLCGLIPSNLIRSVTKDYGKILAPGAKFCFFSFVLCIISCGWPFEHLQAVIDAEFTDFLSQTNESDLNDIIYDERKDTLSKLVMDLSKSIRSSSPTTEQAISALQTCLEVAVRESQTSIICLLLEYNGDLDASHQLFQTMMDQNLLHLALCEFGKQEEETLITQSLISHGANVACPDKTGLTPIEMAAKKCDAKTFQLFWNSAVTSSALEASPKFVEKVLYAAISEINQPVLEFLIHGLLSSSFMPDDFLLRFAVRQQTSTFLKSVIDQGYELDGESVHGGVFEAQDGGSEDQDSESQESDSEEYEETEDQDSDGQNGTSLIEKENTEITARGLHAIYLAARPDGSLANFTFLVDRGVQVSHQYHNGNTILHILASNHDKTALIKLQILLKSDPELDVLNNAHLTPLALAIRSKNILGMELLLDAGASLEIELPDSQTVLHMACYLGNDAAVGALLARGCPTWKQNSQGLTPKDVALSSGYVHIATNIQDTINRNPVHHQGKPSSPSQEKVPGINVPNLAQTGDHGKLPLRILGDDSNVAAKSILAPIQAEEKEEGRRT